MLISTNQSLIPTSLPSEVVINEQTTIRFVVEGRKDVTAWRTEDLDGDESKGDKKRKFPDQPTYGLRLPATSVEIHSCYRSIDGKFCLHLLLPHRCITPQHCAHAFQRVRVRAATRMGRLP